MGIQREMIKSLLLLAVLAIAAAQDDATTTTTPTDDSTDTTTTPTEEAAAMSVSPDMLIMMQVQMEQAMAKKYLDLILRLQHSMYSSQAASSFIQLMTSEYQEDRVEAGGRPGYGGYGGMYGFEQEQAHKPRNHRDSDDDFSFLERGSQTKDLEEDTLFVNYDSYNDGTYAGESNEMQAKIDLFGSLQLFYSVKIKLYQTLTFAADLQQEFYFDRMTTYMISMFGQGAPAQLTQLFYMKTFSTQLKTLKLALTLQTISHFTTWLEDAIDVGTALVADVPNAFLVAEDQDDDLIRDKMFAFSTYNQLATVNFLIFYIDMYLEYTVVAAMGGGAAPPAASFLEEEVEAEPSQSQSQFMPYMYYNYPQVYTKFYQLYHLIFTMSAAHSGLMSVMLESAAYEKEMDMDEFNDDEAEQQRTMAQHMFGAYAQNLMMASQLEYFTSIYELFGMFMGGGGMGQQAPPAASN